MDSESFEISSTIKEIISNSLPLNSCYIDILTKINQEYESGNKKIIPYISTFLGISEEFLKKNNSHKLRDQKKFIFSEIYNSFKSQSIPIMIDKLVIDIDEIVIYILNDDWVWSKKSENIVKQVLGEIFTKYKLQNEVELFNRAFDYIREYN
ncbi:MAG: hypothetical protein HeimC2_30220 [Candidatus Heimdallarchaeota archaeon LC_2]|nr:MAG: hypothetical protein HeimC2_30220 [Candidatus Heimdallarchaeota archaeon LC_2]